MLLILCILGVFGPLSALICSKLYAILWGLTLSAQFGPGPSSLSWFGISMFVSLAFAIGTLSLSADKPSPTYRSAITRCISIWLALLYAIVMVMFVKWVLGW